MLKIIERRKSMPKVSEKKIENLESLIKSNIKDNEYLHNLFQNEDTLSIIIYILSKNSRSERDIFILNNCLKSQKYFIELLKLEGENFNDEELLTKISYLLRCNLIEENTFLFKVGNKGYKFYIILKGNISILVPKTITLKMKEEQYIHHLQLLYSCNEKHLLEKTINFNLNIFKIKEELYMKKVLNLINENTNQLNIPIDEYIKYINGEKDIDESSKYYEEVKIEGYVKIIDLKEGETFGEIALINEDFKRTASIFVNKNSIFGILKNKDYKFTMKSIQIKIKRNDIHFILNSKLFENISVPIFTNCYLNFFVKVFLKKGNFIFQEGNQSEKIFFVYNGEIELKTKLNLKRINYLISYFSGKKLHKKDMNKIGEDENVVLSIAKKGDLLGLSDCIFNGNYFCSAIVISEQTEIFSIDKLLFVNIWKTYNSVKDNLQKIIEKKENIMLDRLLNIKNTYLTNMIGGFKDKNENCISIGKNNINIHQLFKRNFNNLQNNISNFKMNIVTLKTNLLKESFLKRKIKTKKKKKIFKFNSTEDIKKNSNNNSNIMSPNIKNYNLNNSHKNSTNSSFNNNNINYINTNINYRNKIPSISLYDINKKNNISIGNYSSDGKILRKKIHSANPRNLKKKYIKSLSDREIDELSSSKNSDFVSQMNVSKKKSGSFYNYVDCLIMEKSKSKEKNNIHSYKTKPKNIFKTKIKTYIPINYLPHSKPLKILIDKK